MHRLLALAHLPIQLIQACQLAEAPRRGEGAAAMTIKGRGKDSSSSKASKGASKAPAGIADGGGEVCLETDEDYARQMQAKLDAQEARRGCSSNPEPYTSLSCHDCLVWEIGP